MNSPAKPSFYRPELDILRFFAFVGVFVVHTVSYSNDFFIQHHVPPWAAEMATGLARAGAYGVDVFFVLSAYLITELLLREKDATNSLNIRAFYVRRILRIWPLYFFFILLVTIVPYLDPEHVFRHRYALPFLLFLGNWAFVIIGWPIAAWVPLWSVSVEEQFYLLWPPIAAWLTRRQMVIAAVVMILVANLSRLLALALHETTEHIWSNTFAHLDSIAVGILLAAVLRGKGVPINWPTRIGLIALGLVCLGVRGHFVGIDTGEPLLPLATVIGYPAVVLACTAIVAAFIGMPIQSAALQYLGKISYGLYVYHMACIVTVDKLLHSDPGIAHAGVRLILAMGLTIAVSALSYAVIEKPFLQLKRRFTVVASRPA